MLGAEAEECFSVEHKTGSLRIVVLRQVSTEGAEVIDTVRVPTGGGIAERLA